MGKNKTMYRSDFYREGKLVFPGEWHDGISNETIRLDPPLAKGEEIVISSETKLVRKKPLRH